MSEKLERYFCYFEVKKTEKNAVLIFLLYIIINVSDGHNFFHVLFFLFFVVVVFVSSR